MIETQTRNASLADLAELLKDQHARKVDIVTPSSKITAQFGDLIVAGSEPVLSEEGVTQGDGRYRPTGVCDEGIADKFGIPLSYVRRLRSERVDLFDANVNGWLHGGLNEGLETLIEGDPRSFLLRCFKGDADEVGIARAFLSDRYAVMDNLDVLTAALDGVRRAGVEADVVGCDLTDRRMYVRIAAPQVKVYATELLKNYRSPFTGNVGSDNPTVFAGLEISNSEVGAGAFSLVPRMVVEVCTNGMKITKDAMRAVHLGSRMDEGIVRWTEDTQRKNLELVTAKTRDAVATFLDVKYMTKVIRDIEEKANKELTHPVDAIAVIGKKLAFDQATIDGVLGHFVRGGDTTAGGLMNAVTSWSQTVLNADAASDLEAQAMKVLEMAASA